MFDGPAIDFLNVKYLLTERNRGINPSKYRIVVDDPASTFILYENISYLPRFFLAPQTKIYTNKDDIRSDLRTDSENINQTLLVYDDGKGAKPQIYNATCIAKPGGVNVTSYSPNRIKITTNASCDAYLGSSEVMYPGWHAEIDGKTTQIYEADLAFRSVFIPRGNHTIVFWFRPAIFLWVQQ